MPELNDVIPSPKTKYWDVQRCGTTTTLDITQLLEEASPEYRFLAQQTVAFCKLAMLRYLIGEGLVPCKPLRMELQVVLKQDALSDEILYASHGDRGIVPEEDYHIATLELPSFDYQSGWLPQTNKEKELNGD